MTSNQKMSPLDVIIAALEYLGFETYVNARLYTNKVYASLPGWSHGIHCQVEPGKKTNVFVGCTSFQCGQENTYLRKQLTESIDLIVPGSMEKLKARIIHIYSLGGACSICQLEWKKFKEDEALNERKS